MLKNVIDFGENCDLQEKDLLRQLNPFRNQARCVAVFLFVC